MSIKLLYVSPLSLITWMEKAGMYLAKKGVGESDIWKDGPWMASTQCKASTIEYRIVPLGPNQCHPNKFSNNKIQKINLYISWLYFGSSKINICRYFTQIRTVMLY